LQGTLKPGHRLNLDRLIEDYQSVTGDKVAIEEGKGAYMGKQWANQGKSPLGFRLWFNLPGENGDKLGHILVSLSGSVLGRLSVEQIRELSRRLLELGFKATRFDVAMDDYDKRVGFSEIVDALRCGNFARFKTFDIVCNGGKRDFNGWTIYCGSNQSDRRLRIYDKQAESKGEIDAIRWEIQCKGKVADVTWYSWLECPLECSAQYLGGLVIGQVEFIERKEGERNVPRMKALPWWKELKDAVAFSIRHSVQSLKPNLKKAKEWIRAQVSKTLAIIQEVCGEGRWESWLMRVVDEAPQRFKDRDLAKIEQWRYEFENYAASC
jgi:DNA relaxase NicK